MRTTVTARPKAVRRSSRSGLALIFVAVVAALFVVLWLDGWSGDSSGPGKLVAGFLGRPSLSISSATLTSANGGTAEEPHSRSGLVPTTENRGQVLFGRYCDSCHTGGREFSGPSFRTADFKAQYPTADSIFNQVRAGGFDMPAFPDGLISDNDLHDIVQYVTSLPQDAP